MEITLQMINNLSHLARLSFEPAAKEAIRADLSRMVGFIEQLQLVDTAGVEPLLFMSDATNIWREDEVKGSIEPALALRNAPAANNQYFKVPTVIKK